MEYKECNLKYEFDSKTKYVNPDKRVLVYQPKLEVPKRFRIPSAVYYTMQDLLIKENLEIHLNNILYIFNESIILLDIAKQRVNIFKKKDAYNSYTDLDELAHFYSIHKNQNSELIQIIIKTNLNGKKHDITIKSKDLMKSILENIALNIGADNWNDTSFYENKKEVSDSFDTKKYGDFFVFSCCKFFNTYLNKNCKKLKKYKAYFLVGQIFVILDLLDSKEDFQLKNDKIYNYTSYYKYLTDNIRNCLNRMPDFYKKK